MVFNNGSREEYFEMVLDDETKVFLVVAKVFCETESLSSNFAIWIGDAGANALSWRDIVR